MEDNIIKAWKNPEYRSKTSSYGTSHPSGLGFQELSVETMESVAGGNGDAQLQVTPATPYISAFGVSYVISKLK